jgi:hypothetical protein
MDGLPNRKDAWLFHVEASGIEEAVQAAPVRLAHLPKCLFEMRGIDPGHAILCDCVLHVPANRFGMHAAGLTPVYSRPLLFSLSTSYMHSLCSSGTWRAGGISGN